MPCKAILRHTTIGRITKWGPLVNKVLCASAIVAALAAAAMADWPQFQGPNRDGVSTETIPLADSWPAGGPRVLWKIEDKLGTGFGGPVVAAGRVYLLDRVNDQQDVLRAIDLASGKEEWTFAYYAPPEAKDDPAAGKWKGDYNGSRNLPTVDASGIYILGPFGDLTASARRRTRPFGPGTSCRSTGPTRQLGHLPVAAGPRAR